MMRRKLGVLACAAVSAALTFSGVGAAVADEATTPANETKTISVPGEDTLKAAVKSARELGIEVTETTKTQTVELDKVAQEYTTVAQSYKTQLASVKAAIAQQKEYNEAYTKAQEEAMEAVLDKEWTVDELKEQIGSTNLGDVAVITKQDTGRDAEHPFQLKLTKQQDSTGTYLTKGDVFTYENVLKDPKTGKWVDLSFTVDSLKTMDDGEEYTDRVLSRDIDKVKFAKPSAHPAGILEKHLGLTIEKYVNATYTVSFLNHEDGEPVTLSPLMVFTDIDAFQGVKIQTPKVTGTLIGKTGSHLTVEEDSGVVYSDETSDTTDGTWRSQWAVFFLQNTSKVTYTYFHGTKVDTLHQIGGTSISYTPPTKQYAEPLDVTYTTLKYNTVRAEQSAKSAIFGDISVKPAGEIEGVVFDSEHEKVFETARGAQLDYRATLDVSQINSQIDSIAQGYYKSKGMEFDPESDQANGSEIELENVSSTFTATIEAPKELTFPSEVSAYTLRPATADGSESRFSLAPDTFKRKVKDDGTQLISFEMPLAVAANGEKNWAAIDNFKTLYEAVHAYEGVLTLDVAGVTVADNAPYATDLTVKGTINGNFAGTGVVTNKIPNDPRKQSVTIKQPYRFTWAGEQDRSIEAPGSDAAAENAVDGLDAILGEASEDEQKSIWLTVAVPEPEPMPEPTPEPEPVQPVIEKKLPQTGNTLAGLVGAAFLCLVGGAALVARRHN